MSAVSPSRRALGVGAVVAAAGLWGSTGTIQTLLPAASDPFAVGALRLVFGAAALLALALGAPAGRRGFGALPWRGVVFAGLAIGAYNLLFFRAVLDAGVGVGTAVAIGGAPIWATAYEAAFRRRRPGRLRALGQAISILGVALLALAGGGAGASLTGVILAALAGACYAAYSLATSALGGRAPAATLAAATFSVAALAALPVLFLTPLGWLAAPQSWPAMLFLGVVATGLSYRLYTAGLARVAASTAVTLALAEPVTAWILATLVVGEPLTPQKLAGALLILTGLAAVALVPARREGDQS
ncbi:DMT family transporter [Pikeienuella sp. HZG-20]|uniref:DMT family transporter n=1 Tax=Paludibacillus litoralis TaxID=3133267 RepID=UPI0030EE1154